MRRLTPCEATAYSRLRFVPPIQACMIHAWVPCVLPPKKKKEKETSSLAAWSDFPTEGIAHLVLPAKPGCGPPGAVSSAVCV